MHGRQGCSLFLLLSSHFRRALQSTTRTLATMEHAWETRVLLVSLTFFTLSSYSDASIWSEYYNIVRRESTNWNNWANQSCKVFRGSVLKCMDSGNNISLVGFNGTHCASCYPIPQGGVAVKLSEFNSDMHVRIGKSLKCAALQTFMFNRDSDSVYFS